MGPLGPWAGLVWKQAPHEPLWTGIGMETGAPGVGLVWKQAHKGLGPEPLVDPKAQGPGPVDKVPGGPSGPWPMTSGQCPGPWDQGT